VPHTRELQWPGCEEVGHHPGSSIRASHLKEGDNPLVEKKSNSKTSRFEPFCLLVANAEKDRWCYFVTVFSPLTKKVCQVKFIDCFK